MVDRADPGAAEPAVGAGTFWAVPQARGAPRLSFGGAAGSPEVGPGRNGPRHSSKSLA